MLKANHIIILRWLLYVPTCVFGALVGFFVLGGFLNKIFDFLVQQSCPLSAVVPKCEWPERSVATLGVISIALASALSVIVGSFVVPTRHPWSFYISVFTTVIGLLVLFFVVLNIGASDMATDLTTAGATTADLIRTTGGLSGAIVIAIIIGAFSGMYLVRKQAWFKANDRTK